MLLGLGTPAHCWRFADQRGGPGLECAAAGWFKTYFKFMQCGSLSISCCLSYQRYRTYQIVFKTDPMWPNPTKILLECSLHLPKSFQNPSRIDPMEHQKASWGPLWTPHGTKHHFEHQKNTQVASKSVQERDRKSFQISMFFQHLFRRYFWSDFALLFGGSRPRKYGFRLGETLIFIKLRFSKKVPEITTFWIIFRPQIQEKFPSKKRDQIFSQFVCEKCEKQPKSTPQWTVSFFPAGLRVPPSTST